MKDKSQSEKQHPRRTPLAAMRSTDPKQPSQAQYPQFHANSFLNPMGRMQMDLDENNEIVNSPKTPRTDYVDGTGQTISSMTPRDALRKSKYPSTPSISKQLSLSSVSSVNIPFAQSCPMLDLSLAPAQNPQAPIQNPLAPAQNPLAPAQNPQALTQNPLSRSSSNVKNKARSKRRKSKIGGSFIDNLPQWTDENDARRGAREMTNLSVSPSLDRMSDDRSYSNMPRGTLTRSNSSFSYLPTDPYMMGGRSRSCLDQVGSSVISHSPTFSSGMYDFSPRFNSRQLESDTGSDLDGASSASPCMSPHFSQSEWNVARPIADSTDSTRNLRMQFKNNHLSSTSENNILSPSKSVQDFRYNNNNNDDHSDGYYSDFGESTSANPTFLDFRPHTARNWTGPCSSPPPDQIILGTNPLSLSMSNFSASAPESNQNELLRSNTVPIVCKNIGSVLTGNDNPPGDDLLPKHARSSVGVYHISPETLATLLCGGYEQVKGYVIVDCRYEYEYNGGHIRGARNLWTEDRFEDHFMKSPQYSTNNDNLAIIIHCEFSQKRGPQMAKFLREWERNNNAYPYLRFPSVYILEGGYKAFFAKFPNHCVPEAYTPMEHDNFTNEFRLAKSEAAILNRSVCKKSHSKILHKHHTRQPHTPMGGGNVGQKRTLAHTSPSYMPVTPTERGLGESIGEVSEDFERIWMDDDLHF
eukprot:TRINITY_DN10970_c0_g1_i1.p1 TRINITY_DN10970_c0_g1~~TRINITY_DN10970_c0_g1_i1.p1  ORF type:complete len:696 (-),score=111.21 TRINITY_DN10970_c0_g1_i1:122-2209(-)